MSELLAEIKALIAEGVDPTIAAQLVYGRHSNILSAGNVQVDTLTDSARNIQAESPLNSTKASINVLDEDYDFVNEQMVSPERVNMNRMRARILSRLQASQKRSEELKHLFQLQKKIIGSI